MCDLLVLDDDPLVRVTLVEALRDEGLAVIGAGSETEALAALREERAPRVVVADLDLGTRRNGFVFAAIARMLCPDVAIIYITGRPEAAEGHAMNEREVLLRKPFLPSELVVIAKRMMASQPPREG